MWVIEKSGIVDYQQAFAYQEELVKRKQLGEENDFFLMMEHYPVFTKGKGAKAVNILDKTIPVYTINRGGDLTYHEPGQLVGYIITDLRKRKLNVRNYITNIENLIVNSLRKMDIPAYRNPDIVGVWLEGKKIASIGVAIKKGVTMHGFALNVSNEMRGFQKINPCGLDSEIMSSLQKIMLYDIPIEILHNSFAEEIKRQFLQ